MRFQLASSQSPAFRLVSVRERKETFGSCSCFGVPARNLRGSGDSKLASIRFTSTHGRKATINPRH